MKVPLATCIVCYRVLIGSFPPTLKRKEGPEYTTNLLNKQTMVITFSSTFHLPQELRRSKMVPRPRGVDRDDIDRSTNGAKLVG